MQTISSLNFKYIFVIIKTLDKRKMILNKFKFFNFHDLQIKNALVFNQPVNKSDFTDTDSLNVVLMRNPYDYFEYLFNYYLDNKMSQRLKNEVIMSLKTLDEEAFLEWFSTLNYIPLTNPQTFQLDIRKRLGNAIENLKMFDYIVPYEKIDNFIQLVAPHISIQKSPKNQYSFSLSQTNKSSYIKIFVEKDLQLYQEALELRDRCKTSDFKPLRDLTKKYDLATQINTSKYEGIVDIIKSNMVRGWTYNKETFEIPTLSIYKNGILVATAKADMVRRDIGQFIKHPSNKCGFEAIFEEDMFLPTDTIEIKIIPDNIPLKMGIYALAFFQS